MSEEDLRIVTTNLINRFRFYADQNTLLLRFVPFARMVIWLGLLYRFNAHLYDSIKPLLNWYFVFALTNFPAVYLFIKGTWFTHNQLRRWIYYQLVADTTVFTYCYLTTNNYQSDLFILFLLPMLLASERLKLREATLYFISVSILVFVIILYLGVDGKSSPKVVLDVFINVFLLRWGAYFTPSFVLVIRTMLQNDRRLELESQSTDFIEIVSQANSQSNLLRLNYETFVNLCQSRFHALGVHIHTLSVDKQQLLLKAVSENCIYSNAVSSMAVKNDWNFVTYCLQGKIVIEHQGATHPYIRHLKQLARNEMFQDGLNEIQCFGCFPLKRLGIPFGFLTITFNDRSTLHNTTLIKDIEKYSSIIARLLDVSVQGYINSEINRFEYLRKYALHLVTNSEVDAQLNELVNIVTKLLDVPFACVYLVSDKRDALEFRTSNLPEDLFLRGIVLPFGEGLVGTVAQKFSLYGRRKPLIANNCTINDYVRPELAALCKKQIALPLTAHGRLIGVVTAFTDVDNAPDFRAKSEVVLLFEALSEIAAGSIQLTHSLHNEKQLMNALHKLNSMDLSKHTTHAAQPDQKQTSIVVETATEILEAIRSIIYYDKASFQILVNRHLYNEAVDRTYLQIIEGVNFGDYHDNVMQLKFSLGDRYRPNREVLLKKQPIHIPDISNSQYREMAQTSGLENVRAWLGIPLFFDNSPLGMIALDRNRDTVPFDLDEIENVLRFSQHAAISLRKAEDLETQLVFTEMIKSLYDQENMNSYYSNPGRILQRIVILAMQLTKSAGVKNVGNCYLIQVKGNMLKLVATYPENHLQYVKDVGKQFASIADLPQEQSTNILDVIQTGKLRNISNSTDFDDYFRESNDGKPCSWLLAPIKNKHRVIGIILIEQPAIGYFTHRDEENLDLLALNATSVFGMAQIIGLRLGLATMTMPIMNDQHNMWNDLGKLKSYIEDFQPESVASLEAYKNVLNDIKEVIDKIPLDERLSLSLKKQKRETFSLNNMIEKIATTNKECKKISSRLIVSAETEVNVIGDPEWLNEALRNLFINSAVLVLDNSNANLSINLITYPQANMVNGGINIEIITRNTNIPLNILFELFDEPIQDDGPKIHLGAFIASQIVEFYGGFVTVRSTQETGNTIIVWLPEEMIIRG